MRFTDEQLLAIVSEGEQDAGEFILELFNEAKSALEAGVTLAYLKSYAVRILSTAAINDMKNEEHFTLTEFLRRLNRAVEVDYNSIKNDLEDALKNKKYEFHDRTKTDPKDEIVH